MYIDPGSGSFALQVLLGGLFALFWYLKRIIRYFRSLVQHAVTRLKTG